MCHLPASGSKGFQLDRCRVMGYFRGSFEGKLMKDNELRGLILQKYYNKRLEGYFQWTDDDFRDLPDSVSFDAADLFRICDQLAENGLIDWKPAHDSRGNTIAGAGKINAFGVNVMEGHAKPPISITYDQSRHISVQHSSNVQIGDSNVQRVSIEEVVSAIDHSNAPDAEKAEAKSRLKKFLEHPLVTSIAGGLASAAK